MDDLISRKMAIDAVYKCTDYYVGNLPVMIDKADAYKALADLPAAQSEIEKKIKDIGYTGKEGKIYIGGRLFAVRELAQ